MLVRFEGSIWDIVRWQWRRITLYALVAACVVLIHDVEHQAWFEIPSWPLAVVGSAIGIFVSFRSQAAYGRWWEGRILWGRLVNVSRVFASQLQSYVDADAAVRNRFLHRHICYVHMLRQALRYQDPLADPEALCCMDEALRSHVSRAPNPTYAVLDRQLSELVALSNAGQLDAFRLRSFDTSLTEMLAVQGGCERIRNTPLPRIYAFVTRQLVNTYGVLLPLALVDSLYWATVPANVLVCMSFMLIEEIGRELEEPFSMSAPALPLHAICRTIERDMRFQLGDATLPRADAPDARGVLM